MGVISVSMPVSLCPNDHMIHFLPLPPSLPQGLRPPLPPHTPPLLACLIQACWHQDPIHRPTFTQILVTLKRIRAETGEGEVGDGGSA